MNGRENIDVSIILKLKTFKKPIFITRFKTLILKNLYAILFVTTLLACSKQEIVVIPNNTAPTETIVNQNLKENYVNRLYIALTGRKADNVEFSEALTILSENAFEDDRRNLISNIIALPEYKSRLYEKACNDFLNGVDTPTINNDFLIYTSLLATADALTREFLLYELERLQALKDIPKGLLNDDLSIIDVHKRIVNNAYYDDINMGTENFVVASFNNFMFRYPTQVELAQSSSMVDGFSGILFFRNGTGKADFIDIFFNSSGYFEGLVRTLYKESLFREPTSEEMVTLTLDFAEKQNYKTLQINLLASDAYFFN